jgi:hypothetical protein
MILSVIGGGLVNVHVQAISPAPPVKSEMTNGLAAEKSATNLMEASDSSSTAGCRPQFKPAVGSPFGAGDFPSAVAVGDFNRDGKQDLAVTNFNSDDLTIRLGNGTGSFPDALASTIAVGNAPVSVAVGDFNNDGKQDLAIGKIFSTDVAIRLGNGAGGFPDALASTVSTGANPVFVAIGDFNRDGNQDLALAIFGDSLNPGDQNVTIKLGDGTGAFPSGSSFLAGDRPEAVAVGDFNRDGIQDLAVANGGGPDVPHSVTIRLGDGEGNFPDALASSFNPGASSLAIAVGDFNRDGKQDLAVVLGSKSVMIRLGDGAGGFPDALSTTVGAGDGPRSIAIGDFNNDAKQDFAVANTASDDVTVRLGDGAGGFPDALALTVSAGDGPYSVAIGDFNRDGKQDLAVANSASDNITVKLNTCTVIPCAGRLNSLTFSQNPVVGGQHLTGTVTLMCASNKDVVVRLTSNKTAARPDVSMVTIPAGQTSATFGITTLDVPPPPRDVVFTASTSTGYVRAILQVNP